MHTSSSSGGGSSSRSSQDKRLSPFPARSWPEAFHATFIHNIQRKGQDRIGCRRSLGNPVSTTTTTYHHHYPQTLTEQEVGGGKKGGRTLETQSHSHSCSFTTRPVIRGITRRLQSLKVNKSAVKGNNFDTQVVYLFSVKRVIS